MADHNALTKNIFGIAKDLAVFWRSLIVIITPLILLVFPLKLGPENGMESEMNCAYVVLLMAIYWMTEALPISVTSFLPIFLFPALGILPAKETTTQYLKDTNFLFFAGLMLAAAVEHSNLHKRIALRVLLLVGAKPRWLMLGFMCVTCFLSMWMSNTATTAMMVPIAMAVLEALFTNHPQKSEEVVTQITFNRVCNTFSHNINLYNLIRTEISLKKLSEEEYHRTEDDMVNGCQRRQESGTQTEHQHSDSHPAVTLQHLGKSQTGICKAVLLCICYSANIGGTGTLTGTGPNLVMRGILDTIFDGEDTGITFASWMPFAIPAMLICLLIAWLWLQFFFFGIKETLTLFDCCRGRKRIDDDQHEKDIEALLLERYRALGSIRFAEVSVFLLFIILVALWILRDPKFIDGWGSFFKDGYMTDASIGMLIGCFLFAWPNQFPDFYIFRKNTNAKTQKRESLLTWNIMQHNFPWGVIILLGGGFALAKGAESSGLSKALGLGLGSAMKSLSPVGIMSVFVILITFITEVSSNTATASIFIPILCELALSICVHPLYFVLPITIACSFAFMIPVATPPNAIVYEQSKGLVTMRDMMTAGFVMNWLCIGVTIVIGNTYSNWLFRLYSFPHWAHASTNSTCLNLTTSLF